VDSDLERRTIRRITGRIVPFIILLYFVAFLDRVNIGFASLSMNHDIGLSATAFGIGAGLFFIGYFLFEIPSNLILHKVGARIWIARVMVTWGIACCFMPFVRGERSFYTLRFILGVFEAGFFPGIILYLSHWFPARHRASVTALFMAAAPISTALGSPVSGALLQMHGFLGLRGWQWMFFCEAIPAIILGVITFFYLTDTPAKASWLAADEREWLVKTMEAERAARPATKTGHNPLRALMDRRVLALALVYFGTSSGLYTLGIWSPQIIRSFGLSAFATGLVAALPATIATLCMIVWARHSDRTGERTWHVVSACVLAATGMVLAGLSTTVVTVVLALIVTNVGVSSAKPPLWTMPTMFLSGPEAAAGLATINSVGNLGGFAGPAMTGWIKDQTGSFIGGLGFVAGCLILSATLVLLLSHAQKRSARMAHG
jgi:ACS family tartrate transporter-like MFS transporter